MLLGCVGAFWAHQCCCEDRSWAEVDFVREPRVSRGPQLVITAHDFRLVRGREGMYHCVGGRMLMAGGGLREEEHVQDTHTFWGLGDGHYQVSCISRADAGGTVPAYILVQQV